MVRVTANNTSFFFISSVTSVPLSFVQLMELQAYPSACQCIFSRQLLQSMRCKTVCYPWRRRYGIICYTTLIENRMNSPKHDTSPSIIPARGRLASPLKACPLLFAFHNLLNVCYCSTSMCKKPALVWLLTFHFYLGGRIVFEFVLQYFFQTHICIWMASPRTCFDFNCNHIYSTYDVHACL